MGARQWGGMEGREVGKGGRGRYALTPARGLFGVLPSRSLCARPVFVPRLRREVISYRIVAPCPCHPMGALTVRRPRETIPVNFRVATNFDIAINAVTMFDGRTGAKWVWVVGWWGGRNSRYRINRRHPGANHVGLVLKYYNLMHRPVHI